MQVCIGHPIIQEYYIQILRLLQKPKNSVPSGTAAIHVKLTTKLPPRSLTVVDVNINTTSEDKIRMIPDKLCQ